MSVEVHCNVGDLQGSLDFTGQIVDPHNGNSDHWPSPFCTHDVSSEQIITCGLITTLAANPKIQVKTNSMINLTTRIWEPATMGEGSRK